MKALLRLAFHSAWNRRGTLCLTLTVITFSLWMMLAVERLRTEVKHGFSQSVSGTDLVVGARTSPIQLLLYSVFRLGSGTHSMSWQSAQHIMNHPTVKWAIPVTLGDSHKHFPVMGTAQNYFTDFKYGKRQPLAFASGKPFMEVFDVVLGAEVAKKLNYQIGSRIVLNHGAVTMPGTQHADKPFTVTGILQATGTPVDRTLYVSLAAIEAIHLDWQAGVPMPGVSIPATQVTKFNLTPKSTAALFVGLHKRTDVLALQRYINTYDGEALIAVLPGVALDQLWQVVGNVEKVLLLISALAVLMGFIGLTAVMLASLHERRRELCLLRAVGASPKHIFLLLLIESIVIITLAVFFACGLLLLSAACAAPFILAEYGLLIERSALSGNELTLLLVSITIGILLSVLPAYRAYRFSLTDGLIPKA